MSSTIRLFGRRHDSRHAWLMGAAVAALCASSPARADTQVNAFSGDLTSSVPIAVPAFRGLEPKLSLGYSSGAGNGIAGVGWGLGGTSSIERASPGRGTPTYSDATDIFVLDGQELVAHTGLGGTHSTKIQSYRRITRDTANNLWYVWDRSGTKATYTSLVTTAYGTYRWLMTSVQDTSGNVTSYAYACANKDCQLSTVTYNGTTVTLYYEARTDEVSYAIGGDVARVTTRLRSVDVKTSGSRVRAYKLTYATSGGTARSLLASVQQFGKDATLDASGTITAGTSLPAMTYGVPTANNTFGAASTAAAYEAVYHTGAFPWLWKADVNGDGRTDLLYLPVAYATLGWRVMLGTDTGLAAPTTWAAYEQVLYGNGVFVWPMDVNGDGKADLVYTANAYATLGWRVMLANNAGTAFLAPTTWAAHQGVYNAAASGVWLYPADVNGDGKSDLLYLSDAYGTLGWRVMLSTGSSFAAATTWAVYEQVLFSNGRWVWPMDVNGDGKTDLVYLANAYATLGWRVLLASSTGTGFLAATTWAAHQGVYNESTTGIWVYPADVNGDGKTDLLYLSDSYSTLGWRVMLSTGYGFAAATTWAPYEAIYYTNGPWRWAVDVNGDGKADLLYLPVNTALGWRVLLSTGTGFAAPITWAAYDDAVYSSSSGVWVWPVDFGSGKPDLLSLSSTGTNWRVRKNQSTGDRITTLTSSLGGTTTITYQPSSAWPYSYNNPPITQTVSAVTGNDGRGNLSTMGYSYEGGKFDPLERRSLGFSYARQTFPCLTTDGAGCTVAGQPVAGTSPYVETWYSQSYGSAAKPTRQDLRRGNQTLITSEFHEYTSNGATVPYTSLETATWEYRYDATGTVAKRTVTDRCERTTPVGTCASDKPYFDIYGNPTRQILYGDYDVAGDESTVVFTYKPNTSLYIVDKVAAVSAYAGTTAAGTPLTDARTVYDTNTSWDAFPTKGKPTQMQMWVNTTNAYQTKSMAYDTYGNLTRMTDELGAATTITYDATYHLFPITSVNALGHTSSATFDPVTQLETSVTNSNGQISSSSYDALGRLTRTDLPLGGFMTKSTANLGNPTTQYVQVNGPGASGTGVLYKVEYLDGLGRVYKTLQKGPGLSSTNIITDTTYNARGQVATQTMPHYASETTPPVVTKEYDAANRVTKVIAPNGSTQQAIYGPWSVTKIDELGHEVEEYVDYANRIVLRRERNTDTNPVTWNELSWTYDVSGQLIQLTDPKGTARTYGYDTLGRKTAMTDPNAGSYAYAYDGAGRMTKQTHVTTGQETLFTFDAIGRRTQKVVKRANGTVERTVTWGFDEARTGYFNKGLLTSMVDPSGTTTYDCDEAGRLVKTTRTIDGTAYTITRGFDLAGRAKWTTLPDGTQIGTAAAPILYDTAGRVTAIPGFVTGATYTAAGDILTQTNANGTTTTHTYDAQQKWLTRIQTTGGLQDVTYARDVEGKVTGVTSTIAGESWAYAYDALHRLTGATNASNGADNQTFTYDAVGNMLTNSRMGSSNVYQYLASRPHAVTQVGTNTYAYDGSGNMLSGAGRTITWTPENLPATIGTTSFTYDGNGSRIKKVVGSTTSIYLGDDYEVTGGVATKYVALAGRVVAKMVGTDKFWLHTDHQGSIQAVSNAAGTQVQRMKYRPYGERLSTETGHVETRSYTSQRQDESGLIYLHARYYDPALARFISADPLLGTENVARLNGYAYAGNDPINFTDVDGQGFFKSMWKGFKAFWVAVAGVITVAAAAITLVMTGGTALFVCPQFYEHLGSSALKGGLLTKQGREEFAQACYAMGTALNQIPMVGGIAAMPFAAAGAAAQGHWLTALKTMATFAIVVVAVAYCVAIVGPWAAQLGASAAGSVATALYTTSLGFGLQGAIAFAAGWVVSAAVSFVVSFAVGFVAGFSIGLINGAGPARAFYTGMALGFFCANAANMGGPVDGYWANISRVSTATSAVRGVTGPKATRFNHNFDYVSTDAWGGNKMNGPLAGNTPWNYSSYLHDMAGVKEGYGGANYGRQLMPMPFTLDLGVLARSFTGISW
jgi:RHS repeat-associated protein